MQSKSSGGRLPVDFSRIYGGRGIVAVDLGDRVTKAVHIQRQGHKWTLTKSVSLPSPMAASGFNADELAKHLTEVHRLLEAQTRRVVLTLASKDLVLRVAEMPDVPAHDLRTVLRFGSVKYLQQELKNHVFDCVILKAAPPFLSQAESETNSDVSADYGDGKIKVHGQSAPVKRRKLVLVSAIPEQVLEKLKEAVSQAHLKLDGVTMPQVARACAGKVAMPEIVDQGVCGFLDIGLEQSALVIMSGGELVFSRMIASGSAAIYRSLAGALNITPQVAEGLIMTMPEKVSEKLIAAIFPLAAELRASTDFFEDRWHQVVTKLFVSGGESKSDTLFKILSEEVGAPVCERWNPATFLSPLADGSLDGLGNNALAFANAIGAAVSVLEPERGSVNLLAEHLEDERSKQRDPVRWTLTVTSCLAALLLGVGGLLYWKTRTALQELDRNKEHLASLEEVADTVARYSAKAREHEGIMTDLHQQATNRFLWALPLDALQSAVVADVQVARLHLSQTTAYTPAVKPDRDIDGKMFPGQPAFTVEKSLLSISAKDFGEPPMRDGFIQAIGQQPYFKANLRTANSIRLVDLLPRHVDAEVGDRSYVPFTIECVFKERKVVDE